MSIAQGSLLSREGEEGAIFVGMEDAEGLRARQREDWSRITVTSKVE